MFKNIFSKMWESAYKMNEDNILSLLEKDNKAKIIDLGCDDGVWTKRLAEKIESDDIYGVDVIEERLKFAQEKNIKVYNSDLNCKLPFEDNFFDVVHANQVIEHISNLDLFISEIYRILKKGGYVVISTENASSWHNIFASIMGWQIFSLTNISTKKLGIGNPIAFLRGGAIELPSWTHKTIFNYRGLKEFFEIYNFDQVEFKGSGYHPLPNYFGRIDVRHSHFITLKAYKK